MLLLPLEGFSFWYIQDASLTLGRILILVYTLRLKLTGFRSTTLRLKERSSSRGGDWHVDSSNLVNSKSLPPCWRLVSEQMNRKENVMIGISSGISTQSVF